MSKFIKIYNNKNFDHKKIFYGFTGRCGGFSQAPYESLNLAYHVGDDQFHVDKNRELLSQETGVDLSKLSWASQVHGDNIFIIDDEKDTGFLGEYDGIITNLKEVPIMTMFADCIPILLYDSVENVVATIHAGWKGTYLEIASKAVEIMKLKFNSVPKNISALIGPGICSDHYDVSGELAEDFYRKFPEIMLKGTNNLDLRKINKYILEKTGVTNINDMEICTSCQNKEFFSFRQENGTTGRFAALIMLK